MLFLCHPQYHNYSGGVIITSNFWRVKDSPKKLSTQHPATIVICARTTSSNDFPSMPNLANASSPVFATGPRNGPLDLNSSPSNSFSARPVNPHLINPILFTHRSNFGVFSSAMFFPSKMMFKTMIGGNNANATSEFGATDPMSRPNPSDASE